MQMACYTDQVDAHRLLAHVGSGRVTKSYVSNQNIYNQGESADFVFFLQQGRVKLTAISEHGAETVVGIAKEGQFFGEACLHDMPVRLATATAATDCRITSVTKVAIFSAIHDRPRFARMFIEYLSDQNSWVEKNKFDHLLKPVAAA